MATFEVMVRIVDHLLYDGDVDIVFDMVEDRLFKVRSDYGAFDSGEIVIIGAVKDE
jgi:hypothetical protein